MVESTVKSSITSAVKLTKGEPIHVLHVDDEAGFLKAAKPCLEKQRAFHVDTASSVEEAEEKMKTETYDAIVSDYQMPEKGGLEFLKELRQKGNTIPFIIFTGKGREEVVIKALNYGADYYINKIGDPETVYYELAYGIRKAVERKKVEEALKESEERYRTLAEISPAGIFRTDPKGTPAFVNKRWCEIAGISFKESLKGGWVKALHPDDQERICKEWQAFVEEERPYEVECRFLHKNGDVKWILGEAVAERGKEGTVKGYVGTVTDITERKQMEELLRESEEKYRKQFEEAMDAIFIADVETGIIVDCNRAACKLMDREKSELIGKHQRTLHPSQEIDEEFSRTFKQHVTEREGQVLEAQVITKKGEIKDVEIKANVLELQGKKLIQGTFRDVTKRKVRQQALKMTLERLGVLNEKLRVICGVTTHDLRNKLSIVANTIFLAKQKLGAEHEAYDYLVDAEFAVHEMKRVLDFAKTYEALGIEDLVPMDVGKTLEESVRLFSDLHSVKAVNDCKDLTVLADSLLRQLFYNLIDNSLRHGEKVSQIRVYYEETGKDKLKLIYEDDGVGIPEAEKERIFREGYGKGTGYGLYLIWKMCEVYGWTIRETGKHGKGVQFTITIPKMNENSGENYLLP